MLDPISSAQKIFTDATSTLMAHTIRGTQNYFLKHSVSLDVRVIADTYGVIGLTDHLPSILQTRFINASPGRPATLVANIFVHRHANRHLARICIARAIYYLLLELDEFIQSGRRHWGKIERTKAIEEQCDIFALELARKLNLGNRDASLREKLVFFPEELFTKGNAFSTTNGWPESLSLDPEHPFYKSPK